LGHLTLLLVHDLQLPPIKPRIVLIKEALAKDTQPERCYKPIPMGEKGNLVLGTECCYCPFNKECWKDANDGKGIRTFKYWKKPELFVKIVELPRVPEITDAEQTKEQDSNEVEPST